MSGSLYFLLDRQQQQDLPTPPKHLTMNKSFLGFFLCLVGLLGISAFLAAQYYPDQYNSYFTRIARIEKRLEKRQWQPFPSPSPSPSPVFYPSPSPSPSPSPPACHSFDICADFYDHFQCDQPCPFINPFQRPTEIDLSRMGCTGTIPSQGLECLDMVTLLKINKNDLSGTIPPQIGDMTALQFLNGAKNDLTGSIPPELGNLIHLTFLRLSENSLSGSVPPELGLTDFKVLKFCNNNLIGSLPSAVCDSCDSATCRFDFDICSASCSDCSGCPA